jgi:predicted CoA-binding protein
MAKTVILGSVPRSYRYAYRAAEMLVDKGIDFIPVGIQEGKVLGKEILNVYDNPQIEEVHTITLYINATRQKTVYDFILQLAPKRIIFNPGAENLELKKLAESRQIETVEGCTLVMLSVGNY